jgi:repressor LexA
MQQELTRKQRQMLIYLEKHLEEQEVVPSLRQAAIDLGVSHTAVAQMIKSLEKKGYVQREGHYSREIRLLQKEKKSSSTKNIRGRGREVAIIGRITAGLPMYAQQEWDDAVLVDGDLFRAPSLFALRVKGDSMQEAGIFHEDIVICEPRQYAANGEIVVALINNEEATVKRFFLKDDVIELHPENEAYSVMRYNFGEILIQGKVVGLVRGPEQAARL